ncbi:MAG: BamA/TamA family outer membrane protein [Okeania sp. SIO2C2]|uniref:BamA/TamA family outer membrane protein n=1 Tax=Okeania sp. SIO2C2 TaxID=2607787 RepID=UPI0013BC2ACF|nr:BamA/TamA family outer membrane protein [Okeania sp. SIO2C2]NEP88747.1 BamA/TamA family outer membrane protein [Okeania sp. SIO2C2]
MRLSPFLVVIFAASTTFGISKSANAQISKSNTDIDSNFIAISINSRKQFNKFSSTKSFLELGYNFPSQKLFGSINNNFSHISWSKEAVKLDFYDLIKVREITKPVIIGKSLNSKYSSAFNKEFAEFFAFALENLENQHIPQLALINKTVETKLEPTINKQFAAKIPTSEIVENQRENPQNIELAKAVETKLEPTINKQFAAKIPTSEIVENQRENPQNIELAKAVETKLEPTINKQFAAKIPTSEIVENQRENPQNIELAKAVETKLEPVTNKQFAANIPTSEIVENQRENPQNIELAKAVETKLEPVTNKQFAAEISQKINLSDSEITQNQQKLTLDPSDKLAQMPSPEEEVPEEPDSNTPPSAIESEEFTLSQSQPTEPSTGEAEPLVLVAEVVVSGVDGELEDQVYQVITTQAGRTTTRSQLQRDINAIFATGFFRNVKALPEDTPLGVRVTFEVEPNPVLTSVTIEGSQVLPESEVDRIFSEQYGETLNLKIFEGGVEQVNQWYQDNGYVLGQVIGAPQVNDDGSVILEVAEGEIKDIQVRFVNADGETTDEEGNLIEGRTREYIITREIQLQPGDIFQRETAEKDIRRVFGLGIFEDVRLGLEPATDDPNKANVIVNIVEKSTGSLAFGGGVSSASGLFGTVSYQQQNIGGNNQKLGGEFQVGERLLLADISFTDPWIGGDDHRLSYTVNAFRRRAISVIFDSDDENDQRDVDLPNGDNPRVIRTGGGVSFTRPFIPNPFVEPEWTASLGIKYERVEIQDSDGDTEPRDELGNKLTVDDSGEDDLLTIQFGIVNDRRNNPRQPTSGSLLRFGTEQSIPIGSSEIALNRLRANYSFYIPVDFTNFIDGPEALAFNIQGGHIIGDLPPYEAFPLGGTNTVRGYDEGSVGAGRTFLLGTVEYRFPVFGFLGGALFIDAATVFDSQSSVIGNPGGVREKPGDGIGYGAGIRVQSPLGPIRIDYAINDEGDTRFHFGIGERF